MIVNRRARPAAILFASVAALALAAAPAFAEDAAKPAAQPAPAAAAPAPAAPASQEISVDGQPITQDDLNAVEQEIGPNLSPQLSPAKRRDVIINAAINLRLAANEAEKQKIMDDAMLQKKLAFYRQRILIDALVAKVSKDAVTDDAIKKTYDEQVVQKMPVQDEVHARHILVATEDDANKVEARLKAGEDFAKIAKEVSKDQGSADQGGDLGWFTKDRMQKDFAEAAFAMKPGETSQPVKTNFGYHVINVEDRRRQQPPALDDQMKQKISDFVAQQAQQKFFADLRAKAKIVAPAPAVDPAGDGLQPPNAGQPADQGQPTDQSQPAPAPAPAPAQ
jgi:peptidyl-prolyl cis-trans isomerase C